MLPTQYRLTKMKDFEILVKEGKFCNSSLVSAKIWQIDPLKFPRRRYLITDLKIGFVVGLKVDKRAVVRNRLKRQMCEVVRLLLKDGKLKTGYMLMLMAKKEMIGSDYKNIENSVVDVLRKCGLFK